MSVTDDGTGRGPFREGRCATFSTTDVVREGDVEP
jgi:hypothetical protein